jgi:tRNA (guanine-N7-)-methyltransferase
VTTGGRAKKCRQHVNVLSDFYATPLTIEEGWFAREFADPTLPLTIDIGSAFGGWCLDAAALDAGTRNFLGLEVRHTPADTAQQRRDELGLTNCAFLRANANVDLAHVLAAACAAGGSIERILIQFPDPWFKRRHRKRRVVTRELAAVIARTLAASAASSKASSAGSPLLYIASDVLAVAAQMRHLFVSESAGLLRDESEADNAATRTESPARCHGQHDAAAAEVTVARQLADEKQGGAASAVAGMADSALAAEDDKDGEDDVPHFAPSSWLARSPVEVATERERAVLAGLGATSTVNGTCFRALFRPLATSRQK